MSDSSEGQNEVFIGMADDDLASDLSDELRARVKGELEPGERLLWAARSSLARPRLEPVVLAGIVGSLLLFAMSAAFFANAAGYLGTPIKDPGPRKDAPPLGVFLGTMSSMVGCLLAIASSCRWGKFWLERRRLANLCYVVTDRRAIVWVPEPKTDAVRIVSVLKGKIHDAVRIERPDGSGTLELSCDVYLGRYDLHPFGFRHIRDVRRVEQIVRRNLILELKDRQVERDRPEVLED